MQQQKHPHRKQRRFYAIAVPCVLVFASFAAWLILTLRGGETPARSLQTAFWIGLGAAALFSGGVLARWALQNRPKKSYESSNKNDRLFAVLGWLAAGLFGLPVYYVYNLFALLLGAGKKAEKKYTVDFSGPAPQDAGGEHPAQQQPAAPTEGEPVS